MFDFFFSAMGTLFGAVVKTVAAVASVVIDTFAARKTSVETAKYSQNRIYDELREKNEEIEYLKRQQYKSTQENRRLQDLLEQQDGLKKLAQASREILAANTFLEQKDFTEEIIITDSNYHILQWNAFADVISKNCPHCNRKMKVQWGESYRGGMNFFWGCTGFYGNICTYKQNMTQHELRLLTDTSTNDLQVTSQDFNDILEHPTMQSEVIERVNDLVSDKRKNKTGVEIACCPIHGEPMVLSEKANNVKGFLDMYHLKCPHFYSGCKYIEKLKSGAQLAALLKHETGRGIL